LTFIENHKDEIEANLKIKIKTMNLTMVDIEPIIIFDKINKIEMYVTFNENGLNIIYSINAKWHCA
jgi:hypothetical protein